MVCNGSQDVAVFEHRPMLKLKLSLKVLALTMRLCPKTAN